MKVRADRRRGGAAVVALACLGVIALVLAGLVRVQAERSAQVRLIERRSQADWLVEAGLERAAARVAADPSYGGERWAIPAGALGGRSAEVVIRVAAEGGDGGGPLAVEVRADYPADGPASDRVRRSKVFRVVPGSRVEESS